MTTPDDPGQRTRSPLRTSVAPWLPVTIGLAAGAATAWGITTLRDGRYTEYDQPAFHVLTHLPVAVFAAAVAVGALISRRALPRMSTSRAAATMVAAIFGWFGLAQAVEALGAFVAASPRNPGADGAPLHVLGLLLTAATAPTIIVVVGATLLARRRYARSSSVACVESPGASSERAESQRVGAS